MRLMKMLGLAAIAVLAAMAFLGASSASATWNTVLCKQLEHVCSEANSIENETFHLTLTKEGEGGVWILHGLSPLFNILCLSVLLLGEGLELAVAPAQYEFHLSKFDLTNCGTNATHTNCEYKQLALPILNSLLTTTLENPSGSGNGRGTLTKLNGEVLLKCTIPLIGTIDCIYEGAGLELRIENTGARGMVTAEAVPIKKTTGSGFCSLESTITQGLLEPLASSAQHSAQGPLWVSS